MYNFIRRIFGPSVKTDYYTLVKDGAIIIDVRTPGEYAAGHIAGSLNIPVTVLGVSLKKLPDKTCPIIVCCASGMRSASAKGILKEHHYTQVYNAGSWISLKAKLNH